ncbi:MAG: hypothetical protein ACRDY2_00665 [Acidimicrobiales bacterium]
MDTSELLAALEADAGALQAARRLILSDELLSLPQLVRENSLQIAENTRAISELRESVSELTESVSEVSLQIARLTNWVERLDGATSGLQLELAYRNHPYGYFGTLVRRARTLTSDELSELLGDAVEAGSLSDDEARDIALADLIVAGTQAGQPTHLVVEVSRTIGPSDIERASRRAQLLARAGHRALGVVAGTNLSGPTSDEAERAGVNVILDGRRVA